MEKSLSCKDVEGDKCEWSVFDKTGEEILEKAREHARKEHNSNEADPANFPPPASVEISARIGGP
jgi:predicted small metal-binding protein